MVLRMGKASLLLLQALRLLDIERQRAAAAEEKERMRAAEAQHRRDAEAAAAAAEAERSRAAAAEEKERMRAAEAQRRRDAEAVTKLLLLLKLKDGAMLKMKLQQQKLNDGEQQQPNKKSADVLPKRRCAFCL